MSVSKPMTEDELRGLVRHGAITNFFINLVLNAGIVWALLSGAEALTAFGEEAYGPDLLITGFLLSGIISAITIMTHRSKVVKGTLGAPAFASGGWLDSVAGWNHWATCLAIAALGTALSGVLLVVLAAALPSLSVGSYAVGKGVYTGVLAAALVGPTTRIGLRLGTDSVAVATS